MCERLCKLLGNELSYLASGEKLSTSELAKADTTIGLLFATDYAACTSSSSSSSKRATATAPTPVPPSAKETDEGEEELKDVRDCLIQLYGELKKQSDVGSFEVVLIPMMMNQPSSGSSPSSPEDSKTTGIKILFSQPDCPFLLISSEKAEKIQEYLIRKFEITESLSLVLISGQTTEVITFSGKEKVVKDPKGKEFPWKSPSFSKLLESGPVLINKSLPVSLGQNEVVKCSMRNGKEDEKAEKKKHSFVKQLVNSDKFGGEGCTIRGVLFAAFWCPPCRSFLTALIELYQNVNREKKRFEILFISSDRSKESFDRFFATMPWPAIPFEDESRRQLFTKAFNVKAIPHLTLLDDHDNIITTEARLEINDDLEGVDFPWYPRLVDELGERHSYTLNNCLCVIYFTDDSDKDYDFAEALLSEIAEEVDISPVEEAFAPRFFIATDSDLAESLRIFMDLEETRSYLVVMDVANFRYSIQTESDRKLMSEATTKEFLSKFQSNSLEYKYIKNRFI